MVMGGQCAVLGESLTSATSMLRAAATTVPEGGDGKCRSIAHLTTIELLKLLYEDQASFHLNHASACEAGLSKSLQFE